MFEREQVGNKKGKGKGKEQTTDNTAEKITFVFRNRHALQAADTRLFLEEEMFSRPGPLPALPGTVSSSFP